MESLYILVGGNFQNTGARSMTYITVDALKKRNPDCEIVMLASLRDLQNRYDNYTFKVIHISRNAFDIAQSKSFSLKYYVEGIVRCVMKKGNPFMEYRNLKYLLARCNGVFDISGYAISSQFKNQNTLFKLQCVDFFSDRGIPYYFMPQSFGPFDYQFNKVYMIQRIKETMPKAKKIFVREDEGVRLLGNLIGEEKIVKSYDMVLQSSGIDKNRIYKNTPEIQKIDISTEGNVAVVPNMRNFDHGDSKEILDLYQKAITLLLELKKYVYLISHSSEDKEVCHMIKVLFENDSRVIVVEDRIDNWNFDSLIRSFDYAICSRYHSIVHSYRADVPCIALGWATKYRELLEALDQEQYLFDVRNLKDQGIILSAIRKMNENYKKEKKTISVKLAEIQKSNCFDQLDF